MELDALRGIAIALVFAYHCDTQLGVENLHQNWSLARSVVLAGHTGVTLFFLLSGFLIGRLFLPELHGGPPVSRTNYFARRFYRVMPLYGAYLLVATVTCAESLADLWNGVPYLFFLQGFNMTVPLPHWSWVWWSLATEVQFYVLLPLLVTVVVRWRRLGWLLFVLIALAYMAFVAISLGSERIDLKYYWSLSVLGRGPIFVFGMAAAAIERSYGAQWRRRAAENRWLRSGGADLLLVASLLALAVLLRRTLQFDFMILEAHRPYWHIPEAAGWFGVTLMVLILPLWSRPLLVNRFWTTLGVLSYSIYMVHVPLLLFVKEHVFGNESPGWTPQTVLVAVALTAVTVAISAGTYLLIERPMLARKSRLGAAPSGAIANAA